MRKTKTKTKSKKEIEDEKHLKNLLNIVKQASDTAKNAEPLLHMTELAMYEKAMQLDEKRKQTYIQ